MALVGVLKFGSRGDNVRLVQQKLGVTVDGIFGKQTENAVKAFQKEKGLTVDGIVGPQTWELLGLNNTTPDRSTGFLNDSVKTKVTVGYSLDSSGYSVLFATAKKTVNGAQEIFISFNYPITADTSLEIEAITSNAFFEIAQQVAEADKSSTPYIITDFVFVYPTEKIYPADNTADLESQRLKESREADLLEEKIPLLKVEPIQIQKSTPDELKPKGPNKLASIILKYGKDVALLIIPSITNLLKDLVTPDDLCPPEDLVLLLLERRNRIVDQLNKIGRFINKTGQSITGLSNFLNISLSIITTLDLVSIGTSLASKFIPSPPGVPGAVVSVLNDIQTAIRKITFDKQGRSKLAKTQGALSSAALALSITGGYIYKATLLLKSVDAILKKCLPDHELTPISKEIQDIADAQAQAEETFNQTTYQGFIIEIEEIPYTETVNRRRAIGKNSQGITLITTELSFTTNPETLINELKFIIDRDNLKAY